MPAPTRQVSVLLAAGGGALTDLAFPGVGWWLAALVGLAALLIALGRDAARWNLLVGLVWGLAFFGLHLTWIITAVGPVPWAALVIAQAGFVGAFGVGYTWARRGLVIRRAVRWQVPAAALLWVAAEEARSVLPYGGFPWGRIAFSQAESPIGRLAWLGGVPLVSGAVALAAGLLAVAVVRRGLAGRLLAALLGAGVVAGGTAVPLAIQAEAGQLAVGAVQGDVPDRGLASLDQAREVLANHRAGSLALLDSVAPGELDLVLWPENGADFDPRTDEPTRAAVQQVVDRLGAPLLLGTQEYPDAGGRYNLGMLWVGDGPVDVYAKQHPVPFAEYIPMRELARLFSPAVDRVSTDMLAGSGVGLISLPVDRLDRVVGIADVICFEVAYDDIVRDAVSAGGEVLVVQTNNATFGRTDESTQQLAMSQLRAIEHGRATVQISTVGVSAVIAPDGTVLARTGMFTADQLVAALPLRTTLSPAARVGDELSWLVRALGIAVVVSGLVGAARLRPTGAASRRAAAPAAR